MYALPNKTQHKLIVKVRGGISQKLDNFSSPSASAAATGGSNSNHLTNSSASLSSLTPSFKQQSSKSLRRESASNGDSAAECIADLSNLLQPVFHTVNQQGSKQRYQYARKQYITPEHNEMIKYVQQSWKGVERDYKKSVNNVINNLDLNGSSETSSNHSFGKQKHLNAKKKTLIASTPLLLSGSYHHTSAGTKDASSNRQDSFQPFDLEAFWGNRILKRLTEE